MKSLMYGAGNIGRGFIGALLSQSGYAVTFVDISEPVVDSLNKMRSYPVRIVSNEKHEDIEITGVNAIHGLDTAAIAEAISVADIMAVSVGANVLPKIVPNILAGLRARREKSDNPLNILLCENLMDVDKIMEKLLKQQMEPAEQAWLDEKIGLIETSIGRMVPPQTPEMHDGNPLRVCVERYGYLPIDKDAIKGEIPSIKKLVPFSPFGFYLRRKLYLHNMGHAICAYLGMYAGKTYIYEAIDDPYTHLIVKEAMLESLSALSQQYGVSARDILRNADDLLIRFTNRALGDTCARVGGDPARKLAVSDRLIGAALFCEEHGIAPIGIAVGTAGAVYHYLTEKKRPQSAQNAENALRETSNTDPQSNFGIMVLEFYRMYLDGASSMQLFKALQGKKGELLGDTP